MCSLLTGENRILVPNRSRILAFGCSSCYAGTPVSFLFGGLSSTTLRIIDASGYALILLGLLVGLVGSFRKDRGPAVEWSRKSR